VGDSKTNAPREQEVKGEEEKRNVFPTNGKEEEPEDPPALKEKKIYRVGPKTGATRGQSWERRWILSSLCLSLCPGSTTSKPEQFLVLNFGCRQKNGARPRRKRVAGKLDHATPPETV